MAIGIELIFIVATDHLKYDKWWNAGCSYLADWFLYWLFYEFHKFLN